jgi:serine/threonine protein kinase
MTSGAARTRRRRDRNPADIGRTVRRRRGDGNLAYAMRTIVCADATRLRGCTRRRTVARCDVMNARGSSHLGYCAPSMSTTKPPYVPLAAPIPVDDERRGVHTSQAVPVPAPGGQTGANPNPYYAMGSPYISRSRSYAFVVDERGQPIELGSGRFAKAFLGEERWVQSKTTFRRSVAIKTLQHGVSSEDQMRFQLEKEILERVQGHPNIIELLASGESDNPNFIPPPVRDRIENDFLILELMDLSLEERLKGARNRRQRDDLLALPARERLFRVLDYMVPIATAIEYTHRVRDTSHRDLKPANILLKLPDPNLAGSQLIVKLADFNVGKIREDDVDKSMTRHQSVPGTLYFQSPEQEVNMFELLVNVTQGTQEVDYFEDFYIDIFENDVFSIFNRDEAYEIVAADRVRKKLILARPFAEASETNVRAKVTKMVGRPADIYSLGSLFYYLVSGAYANPKSLYDAFRKFIEYEKKDENNSVVAYLNHEYGRIQSLRTPKADDSGVEQLAPSDRFFSYKHFLDGNGELIDLAVMTVIAKAMIRNKPDSYCLSWDVRTEGVTDFVRDLIGLYANYGVDPAIRSSSYHHPNDARRKRKNSLISRILRQP